MLSGTAGTAPAEDGAAGVHALVCAGPQGMHLSESEGPSTERGVTDLGGAQLFGGVGFVEGVADELNDKAPDELNDKAPTLQPPIPIPSAFGAVAFRFFDGGGKGVNFGHADAIVQTPT